MGRLCLLGTPEVVHDEGVRALAGARQAALVALLACRSNSDVSVDLLVSEVWPDLESRQATRALRSEVHRVRAVLTGVATVATRPSAYRLEVDPESLDLAHFESLGSEAWDVAASDPQRCVTLTSLALGMWRGEPFGPLVDVPSVSTERERLVQRRLGLVELRVDLFVEAGAVPGDLVDELTALCAAYPLRESLWARLMRALWHAGRQADALRAYARARAGLVDALGVEPTPALRELEAAILRHELPASPSANKPAMPSHLRTLRSLVRIPTGLGELIGRHDELAQISAAIVEHRLVTIVGPGGVGKTRVAIEAVACLRDDERFDEIVMVDLAASSTGDSVPQAVATACGVMSQPDRNLTEALVDVFNQQRWLLVLDNCEHVLESVGTLATALIRGTSNVRMLATSREPLGLLREQVFGLTGLDAATDGQALFRARAASAGAKPHDEDPVAVLSLCESLDGVPLAIELVASRSRAFDAMTLLGQLRNGALLDTHAGPDRPERHRTLRATIGWSYELLPKDEQALLRALATMSGSFDTAAATAVGAFGPFRTAGLIAGLIDRSLLQRVSGAGPSRYRMLEIIRQFAVQESNDEERAVVEQRHRAHYAAAAGNHRRAWRVARSRGSADDLRADWANLRRAFEHAVSSRDGQLAGAMCAELTFPCLFLGLTELGEWADQLLQSGLVDATSVEAAVRGAAGVFAHWCDGDPARALAVTDRWRLGTAPGVNAAYHLAAFMGAQALGDRALTASISTGWSATHAADDESAVLAPAIRGYHGLWMSDPAVDVEACTRASLSAAHRAGSPMLTAYALIAQAQVDALGDLPRALDRIADAQALCAELPVAGWLGCALLYYRAAALAQSDDLDGALSAAREVLVVTSSQRLRHFVRWSLRPCAICLDRLGDRAGASEIARLAGPAAAHSSMGAAEELERRLGPIGTADGSRVSDMLDAANLAIERLDQAIERRDLSVMSS